MELKDLPALDSGLNGLAGVPLVGGCLCVRRGRIAAHKAFMPCAFTVSTLFLVSYPTYHFHCPTTAY